MSFASPADLALYDEVDPRYSMNNHEPPLFEVTDHHSLSDYGGFVIGHIRSGVFKIGMRIRTGSEPAVLTICGIEYLDNIRERKFWNALVFREHPSLEFVRSVFPVGSVLHGESS